MMEQYNIRNLSYSYIELILSLGNHEAIRSSMLTLHEISQQQYLWRGSAKNILDKELLICEDGYTPLRSVKFSGFLALTKIVDCVLYLLPIVKRGARKILGPMPLGRILSLYGKFEMRWQMLQYSESYIKFYQCLYFQRVTSYTHLKCSAIQCPTHLF